MLNKIYKSPVAQRFKANPIALKIKNSFLVRAIEQSVGDWRYPFMRLNWWFVRMLVPRRKVMIDDVSFTLSCTNWITHFRWYLFKTKEPEVRNYINNYVKEGDIFFDIGANVGVFSVYCGNRYKNISIYSFEPEYSNLNLLKDNVFYNGLTQKCNIYSVAISDFIGFSMLNLQDWTPGAACHTESRQPITMTGEGYRVIGREGIISVTLDYIFEQLGVVPNSMKIDTDGNEDKVLEGGVRTLSNTNLRSLVIEIPHEDAEKSRYCYKLLESAGLHLEWSDRKKTRNEIWVRHLDKKP